MPREDCREWRLFLADRYGALAKTVTAPFSESTRSNWLGVNSLNVAVKPLPFFILIKTFLSVHSRYVPGSMLSGSAEPMELMPIVLSARNTMCQGRAGAWHFPTIAPLV